MKKIYYVNVRDNSIIEGILVDGELGKEARPLKRVSTIDGIRFVPPTTKLWESKEELVIKMLTDNYRKDDLNNLVKKYHLSREETKQYLKKAIDKSPEKFI